MTLRINEIAGELSVGEYEKLNDAYVSAVRFFRADNRLEIDLECDEILPCASFCALREALKEKTGSDVSLSVKLKNQETGSVELHRYLEDLYDRKPETSVLSRAVLLIEGGDKTIRYLFTDDEEREMASAFVSDVEAMLAMIGLSGWHAMCDIQKIEVPAIKDVHVSIPQSAEEAPAAKPARKNYYRTKQEDYTKIELKDIHDPIADIQFECDVFNEEITEIKKTGRIIQSLSVYDGTDAIIVKRFENNRTTREELQEIGKVTASASMEESNMTPSPAILSACPTPSKSLRNKRRSILRKKSALNGTCTQTCPKWTVSAISRKSSIMPLTSVIRAS